MLSDSILTQDGRALYRDDEDAALLHVLPSGLALAAGADGRSAFTLLYYQEDFPERGARLVATFAPELPSIPPDAVPEPLRGARIEGVSFGAGEAWLTWGSFATGAAVISELTQGSFRIELGLSRDEARAVREALRAGGETVRVQARLGHEVGRRPIPLRARIDLPALHAALAASLGDGAFTGARLRAVLSGVPAAALRLEPTGTAPVPVAVTEETAEVLAPFVAARVARPAAARTVFDACAFTLARAEEVARTSLLIDLSRARGWQRAWEGEWSLTAFHQRAREAGQLRDYFPEVLALPAVGNVQLLVENLLPVDGRCIDEVIVRVLHPRLNSLEEDVFEARYDRRSGAVARRAVPRIAYRPFAYRYQVQARLVAEDPSGPSSLVPDPPELRTATEPILRIGPEILPFVLCHVSAEAAVFDQVSRAVVELSAAGDADPVAVRTAVLTRDEPYRWVTLPPDAFRDRALRWRALLHASPSGPGKVVAGPWQTEGDLRAAVTRTHVFPREPVRVRATAAFRSVPEIERLECELCSGRVDPATAAADLRAVFAHDETRELVVWPSSIFDEGVSYRYAVGVSAVGTLWTDWRHTLDPRIVMSAEDDFYAKRTITASLQAPWSERASPDPDSTGGEIIYAELHVQPAGPGGARRIVHTFDRTNAGTEIRWTYRARRGAARYAFQVDALTVDGRIVTFGPIDTEAERLSLEIYRARVSDAEPAEFGLRAL